MDLFTPVVPPEALHPNFRSLADKHSAADRAVLAQWADGFKDRDGKFVREFQTTFNSGFWELYIFACCKELGFRVNLALTSPDFVVDNFQNEFCIEAAIASNAIGESAEWERNLKQKTEPDPERVLDTAVVRLSNAIDAKYKKYQTSYQNLPHVKKRPFILAIGPFEQPYFWAHNDHAIRQVLYAYDRIGPNEEHLFRHSIAKPSGKRHAEWLKRHREWEKQEAIRLQKQKERKHAEALAAVAAGRKAALLKAAENWRQSQTLLDFLRTCETQWKNQSGTLTPEQTTWLTWANEIAVATSPFSAGYPEATNDGTFDPTSIPPGGPYPVTRRFAT